MTSVGARLLRTRWFVRAPIAVFRARLGFLFGGRLLLLEHTGRRSGRPRYVVLETVARPGRTRAVIASGFGAQAQWFRNLAADPHCYVSIAARHRVPAVARVLSSGESAAVLDDYRRTRPRAYRNLSRIIEEATSTAIGRVPMVELSWDS
ncbi:nitroreductase family deazaflavin-dependent oxidoreductase [Nocardia sp. NPDC019255]|uniref:nitroreductase family deazaflavin-dependent oxidoreductase n=1 Tax=unclassified Nocardia TaxID=2637762 RepID=UPI0033D17E05